MVDRSKDSDKPIILSYDEVTGYLWNSVVGSLPNSHVFQTWEWGQLKQQFGWEPHHIVWRGEGDDIRAAALILQRKAPIPGLYNKFSVFYIPKGPLLEWGDSYLRREVLKGIFQFASSQHAIFIKIDPDVNLGIGYAAEENEKLDETGEEVTIDLRRYSWIRSIEQIQFPNTVLIDLTLNPDEILARMKQKTRYNIRLAQRKGVVIRHGSDRDLEKLYKLYAETSVRDGFVIREKEYYLSLWRLFVEAGMATPLIAEVDGRMIASLILFSFSRKAWFLYGMSSDHDRDRMPNYLLQWEAIQLAKAMGCLTYDLWGAPDKLTPSDPLWGVYRFKEGFGGQVVRHIGAWDRPVHPSIYHLYVETLPRLLSFMRWKGKLLTRRTLT